MTATQADSRPATILVVDDEPLLRWALRETLGGRYLVHEAASVREAAALVARLGPVVRLLVLDLRLPDGSGLDLLECVRAACPDCHIVMLTAFADAVDAKTARERGVRAILEKPIQMDDLLRYVGNVLGS